MSDALRKAAQAALDWIDKWWATGSLNGVSNLRDQLRVALAEEENERNRLIGIVADLAAWREFASLDRYDLADAAVRLMDEIQPDWRLDYEESDDE